MSDSMSSAEKRRLLREKRAAKLAQGGSRLNKIIGGNDSLLAKEPEEIQKPDIVIENVVESTGSNNSTEESTLKSRKNKFNKSNRISMVLNENDADPPTSNLDEFENYTEQDISLESGSPLQEFISDENVEVDMEQLLNRMLQNSGHDQSHPHGHGEGIPPMGEDPFAMFSKLSGMAGKSNSGGLFNASTKSDIEIAKSKLYLSGYSMFRLFVVLLLVCTKSDELFTSSGYSFFNILTSYFDKLTLWPLFLTVELIFSAIYLLLSFSQVFPNNTILSFDISSFGHANSALTAYGVIRSFFVDLCALVLILGFSAYFTNSV